MTDQYLSALPLQSNAVNSISLLVICTLGLALTNGTLTAIAMATAPTCVPLLAQERAGSAMVLSLVLGLTLGAALSFLWLLRPSGS